MSVVSPVSEAWQVLIANAPQGALDCAVRLFKLIELGSVCQVLPDGIHPLLRVRVAVALEMRKGDTDVVVDILKPKSVIWRSKNRTPD